MKCAIKIIKFYDNCLLWTLNTHIHFANAMWNSSHASTAWFFFVCYGDRFHIFYNFDNTKVVERFRFSPVDKCLLLAFRLRHHYDGMQCIWCSEWKEMKYIDFWFAIASQINSNYYWPTWKWLQNANIVDNVCKTLASLKPAAMIYSFQSR